jgi:hypothetical protein
MEARRARQAYRAAGRQQVSVHWAGQLPYGKPPAAFCTVPGAQIFASVVTLPWSGRCLLVVEAIVTRRSPLLA